MRAHDVNMLTLGQYLQPSLDHLAVERFVTPQEFDELGAPTTKIASACSAIALTAACRLVVA